MKSTRIKAYADLLIKPKELTIDWLVGYWTNATFTNINSSSAYKCCRVNIRDYAGYKVQFRAYRYCGFELLDGTRQGVEVEVSDYSKLLIWDIPSNAAYMYISYAVGQTSDNKVAVLCVVRYRRKVKDADVYLQYCDGDGYFTRAHMYLD